MPAGIASAAGGAEATAFAVEASAALELVVGVVAGIAAETDTLAVASAGAASEAT